MKMDDLGVPPWIGKPILWGWPGGSLLSRGSFRQLRRGFGEGGALPGSSQKLQGVICNAVTLWQINIDPENNQFLMETNLPTPIWQGLC